MSSPNEVIMDPKERLLINEASVATGIVARRINQLLDDEFLPGSAAMKVANRRRLHAYAVPMVSFGATGGSMLSKGVRLEAMHMIERYAEENWRQLWRDPGSASGLRFECGCITIALGGIVTEAMLGLKRWAEARNRVVEIPDIRGGMPVLRGTRVGVYEAADALAGDGLDAALNCLPSLCREDLEAAAQFEKVYPRTRHPRSKDDGRRLIDRQIVDIRKHANAESANQPLA